MFCNKCGKPTADTDAFCRYCGNKLSNLSNYTDASVSQPQEVESTAKPQFDRNKCSVCGGNELIKVGLTDYCCDFCGSKFTVNENNEVVDSKLTESELLDVYVKANKFASLEFYVEELQLYLEHLSKASDNPLFLVKLGRAYRHCDMYDKAIEVYNTVIAIDPTYGAAYTNIGAVYIFTKQYKYAEENIRKGIAVMCADRLRFTNDDIGVAYSNLALSVGYQGRKKDAVKFLAIAEKEYDYKNGDKVRNILGIKKGLFG